MRDQVTSPFRCTTADLDGRRVVRVEIDDATDHALTEHDGEQLAAAIDRAVADRIPFVAVLGAAGVDPARGIAATASWGRAARALSRASGRVPTLIGVDGPLHSGPALLLGLADVVVMTRSARAFVSGPSMVAEFTGVDIAPDQLGGAGMHTRSSGVASLVVDDREQLWDALGHVLDHLPDHVDALPPMEPADDPLDRTCPDLLDVLPTTALGSYDVRDVIRDVVDDGEFLELRAGWAPNLVTAFARVGGRPIGVVANQTQALAGSLDIPASQKGARFVAMCDAFNLGLLTLVDTSGFLPGKDQEWRGMIRHGAQLAFAYARATVPRVGLILRKSYGGAYIVMDSRHMGNDVMLAWPSAEVAVMGAKGAVEILHRRADADERVALEADYTDRFLTPYPAAERGSVSMIIDPADTRLEVAAAFDLLETKREKLPRRRHDNGPL